MQNAFLVVRGLTAAQLRAFRGADSLTELGWQASVKIQVAGANGLGSGPPVAGRYVVNDTAIEFHPRFPFDAGRLYEATVYPEESMAGRAGASGIGRQFALPVRVLASSTAIVGLFPSGDTVPENLLRMYIEFSAPMSRTGGLDFIKLLDDRGREVKAAFLPLEADFWNAERTRYTVFLDPGRVKRGILPNEQLGRAILAGRRYSIVVDSAWPDANGRPLTASFRRAFQVAKPDERVIELKQWSVTAPAAGTHNPLIVRFPKSLDQGLLKRALGVETSSAKQVQGTVEIAQHETEWRFTPAAPWQRGTFQLLVLSFLEDAAGNQIDKPFEVDMFERVDRSATPERRLIPFTVK